MVADVALVVNGHVGDVVVDTVPAVVVVQPKKIAYWVQRYFVLFSVPMHGASVPHDRTFSRIHS